MKKLIFKIGKAISIFQETFSSKEIDSRIFRRQISYYFYEDFNYDIISTITEVKVFEEKSKFILKITTHRPGILIGRGGKTIDALRNWLNNGEFSKPVEIDLQESKLWHKLYDAEFV